MAIELERRSTAEKGYSDSLYEVRFVPVSARAEYQEGPIAQALERLRALLSEKDFAEYIDQLLRINYDPDAGRLMLITKKEIHRTMIEGRLRKAVCEAFEARYLRVVSQA